MLLHSGGRRVSVAPSPRSGFPVLALLSRVAPTWLIVRRLAPEPGTEDELLIVEDIAEMPSG